MMWDMFNGDRVAFVEYLINANEIYHSGSGDSLI